MDPPPSIPKFSLVKLLGWLFSPGSRVGGVGSNTLISVCSSSINTSLFCVSFQLDIPHPRSEVSNAHCRLELHGLEVHGLRSALVW